MSSYESPWSFPFEDGDEFLSYIPRHWPHYQRITLSYSLSWTASRTVEFAEVIKHVDGDPPEGHVECAATTRTDTSSGSISGDIVWLRQSEADEMSGQPLGNDPGEFSMHIESNPGEYGTDIVNALFHRAYLGYGAEITGSWTQTIYTGRIGGEDDDFNCGINFETDGGPLTAQGNIDSLGIYESALGDWFKSVSTLGMTLTGASSPIPSPVLNPAGDFSLGGPPAGADIVFADSDTLSTPDTGGWHGSSSASITLTLST